MARTYIILDRTPWTFTNSNSLIVLVMITTELFKYLTSLDEFLSDLDQVGMVLERVGGELRNFGSALEFPHVKVSTTKTKVLPVPVHNLTAKVIAIPALGLLVVAIIEFSSAFLSFFDREYCGARLEDHPYGAVSDYAVENEVIPCLEVVSELGLKNTMKKSQMIFRLWVSLGFQGFEQIFPAVDERLEGRFESQTVQGSCNAGVVFENQSKSLLKKRRLNNNRVDLQLLSTVVALTVTDDESIACTLRILCSLFKIIRVFVNPSCLASIIRLGLI